MINLIDGHLFKVPDHEAQIFPCLSNSSLKALRHFLESEQHTGNFVPMSLALSQALLESVQDR